MKNFEENRSTIKKQYFGLCVELAMNLMSAVYATKSWKVVFSIYKRYVEWDRNSIAILTILFFRCCTLFVNPSSENNTLFSFSYNLFNKFRTWYLLLSYSLRYSFRLFIKKFFSNLENLFFGLIFFLEVGEFFLISFIYWADLFWSNNFFLRMGNYLLLKGRFFQRKYIFIEIFFFDLIFWG